jgi:hypothetical protein
MYKKLATKAVSDAIFPAIGGPRVDPEVLRAASLVSQLSMAEDPRCRRGVRHRLVNVLVVAVAAVAAGSRSFKAMG